MPTSALAHSRIQRSLAQKTLHFLRGDVAIAPYEGLLYT